MKKFRKRPHAQKFLDQTTTLKSQDKYNAPPVNPGIQDVPRSLKDFIKLKELAHENRKELKMQKHYLKNAMIEEIKKKKTVVLTDTRSSLLQDINSVDVASSITNSNSTHNGDPIKTKSASMKKKRKLKLMKLKLKRKLKNKQQRTDLEDDPLQSTIKEDIKFGEVVHKPPQLSVLPRKVTKSGFENRPGRKDDLLLKSLLNQIKPNRQPQLCQRRKLLSASDQRQLELERNKAMLSYKNFKRKTK